MILFGVVYLFLLKFIIDILILSLFWIFNNNLIVWKELIIFFLKIFMFGFFFIILFFVIFVNKFNICFLNFIIKFFFII